MTLGELVTSVQGFISSKLTALWDLVWNTPIDWRQVVMFAVVMVVYVVGSVGWEVWKKRRSVRQSQGPS